MDEQLLEKLRIGEETKEELNQLSNYFSQNNQSELDQLLKRDWEESAHLPVEHHFSERIWQQLEKSHSSRIPTFTWPSTWQKWIAIAAGLVLLVIIVNNFLGSKTLLPLKMMEQVNDTSELMEFTLEDGTIVTLNRGSSIKYYEPFKVFSRDIWLDGEAYFKIKENTRPFRIVTGNLRTTSLGTEFNIDAHQNARHITISLVSGSIAVSPTEKIANQPSRWLLEQGDQMRFHKHNKTPIVYRFDSTLTLAWKENRMAFDNEPLESALLELEQHFDQPIQYDKHEVADCIVEGEFKKDATLTSILRKILPYRKLEFKAEGDVITISGKGCR